ncbi:glycosyltransferase family 4 protein [Pontiellaceae bacterium B1224]|nr:glycosyltransferase family 4 protein [Pontiellaceae bacterium B1224]
MKILVYDDNPHFGGHQIMACHGIEALIATPDIDVILMYNPYNRSLLEKLSGTEKFQILETPCSTQKFQGLRNRFSRTGINMLKEHFQRLEPDLVLCIQGDIEQSSQAVLAAKKCRIDCISYIAIPHRLEKMGAKFGRLRDTLNRYLFNKPSSYITISESMKQLLKDRGTKRPISIVENGIEPPPIPKLVEHDNRFTIGLIGRIEFKQKQQDFFVRSFLQHSSVFTNCRVLIVGSGPDESKLKKLIKDKDSISCMPWQVNMEDVYEMLDMVVIPSRYEGVPLVMLEALARGLPVIGSRVDGMMDLLPTEWTFTTESSASMASTFSAARKTWPLKIEELQHRVIHENSMETFKKNFIHAVEKSFVVKSTGNQ